LFAKPFTETYETQYQLRSFFDHRLPLPLGGEANENIPGDLRDVNQSITHIFTDESRPNDWNQGIHSTLATMGWTMGWFLILF